MNRLFRDQRQSVSGYLALTVFALVYLAALTFVMTPEMVLSALGAVADLLTGSPLP